jgi:hypothetical protein
MFRFPIYCLFFIVKNTKKKEGKGFTCLAEYLSLGLTRNKQEMRCFAESETSVEKGCEEIEAKMLAAYSMNDKGLEHRL